MSRHRTHRTGHHGPPQGVRETVGSACVDHSWAARAAALQVERSAQWALILTLMTLMVATLAWTVVLVPGPGSPRGSPVFWLLAIPLLVFSAGLQPVGRWSAHAVWPVLLSGPVAAGAALLVARGEVAPRLATPGPMAVILAICTAFAIGGVVLLRRSSLPGGGRPPRYLAPGTLAPGARPVSWELVDVMRTGSLAVSGALMNAMFFAIAVSVMTESLWPIAISVTVAVVPVVLTGYLVMRAGWGLSRGRPGAAAQLHFGLWVGAASAALFWAMFLAWPMVAALKIGFSVFMGPLTAAAAWSAHRSWSKLVAAGGDQVLAHATPPTP